MVKYVSSGNNNRKLSKIENPVNRRMLKIEKLGEMALKQVLDMIKKGYTYAEIAKLLSETYEKDIRPTDITKLLNTNSVVMSKYISHIDGYKLLRANLVLDEANKFTEQMIMLDKASEKLQERLNSSITTKDIVEVSKGLTDITRATTSLIKTFKKMTGEFKEGPSILVDQSTKQVNVSTADNESTMKLAKELGMANFNIKKQSNDEFKDNNDNSHIVDAKIIDDEDSSDEEDN